jgi:guanylate kinase
MTPGPLLILSGPAGSGKSTIISRLLADGRWPMCQSVSVTTRPPRPYEVQDVHYHFWPAERFLAARDRGEFLEWAEVFGNYYGTLAAEVAQHRQAGKGVWLVIDVQGWEQVRRRCPDVVSIFLMTSSPEEYERRLRQRRTESEDALQRRLETARLELTRAAEYDYQVYNDDLDAALNSVRAIIEPLFANVKG